MPKRISITLQDSEFYELKSLANSHGLPTTQWIRQTLIEALRVEKRLEALRTAAKHGFPTADIEDMLSQIEQGYRSRVSPDPEKM